jgi:hypothetical protein
VPDEISILFERERLLQLAQERRQLEGKLISSGGKEFNYLLSACGDLADIIEDIEEIASKRSKKERAAFETKI